MKECSVSFSDIRETMGDSYDKEIERIDILDPQFDLLWED